MKLFKVLSIAALATILFACNKEIETPNSETPTSVRTVQFSAGEITKTVFGTPSGSSLPTLWTANKTVGISLNFAAAKESTTPVVGNSGATATFSAYIDDSGSSPYTFYAVSPYTSIISLNDSYYSAQVDIPASQTPLANSVDENAQILIAKYSAGASFPTSSVLMDFSHLTAYGKISFSNLALASGETIESVSLTATENWAGRYYYYFEDSSSNNEGDLVANSAGKTITLTTSSATDIWFACAPVDLGGKTVKVVITTDKATTYTKNITIPAGKTFAAGKVNAFTINMNGITSDTAEEYVLVTNPADLTVGSKVIIAAPGATATAISTTQNTNNRAEASVTKEQNNTVIVSPSDAVQIFTIEAGNKANTIAFNTGTGYIYAASSNSNHMKTEDTLSDNSSWTVSIDSDGIATITAQGTNTRNIIRYNSSNNPPIFACYGSTSTVGSLVSIYKLAVNDTRAESEIAWSDTDGMGDVNGQVLAVPTLVNPNNLTVSYSSSDESVATVEDNTHSITLIKAGVTQIHAVFAGNQAYKPADVYYTLTVENTTTPSGTPGDETFDLSTKTYTTGTDIVTWAGESVIITNETNTGSTSATNYLGGDASNRTSSRFYKDNKLTISPNADYTITSIVFTATSENYANALSGSSWTNATASANGTTVTVTPSDGTSDIIAVIGGTCGFTSIVVNYVFSGVVVTKYDITIDDSITNGSVSADKSKAAEGETVTLTATPASGYALDAWNVYKTGESGTKVTVTSNSFTMPAYPVTVSASFAAVPTITMNTTSITDVAAAGVSATATSAYNLVNGASNSDVTITCDGTVVTAASKNATAGSIDYTVAANSSNARSGWIKVKYGTEDAHEITVNQLAGQAATPTLQYTLDGTVTASGNAYATASTVTQSNIGWKVVGNTEMNPWRIGGKGITGEDRAIYSTTAISANITQINVTSGATASNLTVNSMTISVHNSASDAENGTNAIASKTVTSGIASSTVTFDKEDDTSWAGKFYRIVYNVTRTSTSGNGYISFNSATFYGI